MALFKIDKNYFDTFAVRTEPKRTFTSSSVNGVNGAISVFPLASIGLKEVKTVSDDDGPPIGEADVPTPETLRHEILSEKVNSDGLIVGSSSQDLIDLYMKAVNQTSVTVKNQKKVEVLRFEPSFRFTSDTVRKSVVQNVLFPYYRAQYGTPCNWSFSNYHTLNFFTAKKLPNKAGLKGSGAKVFGSIPKQSALIYPLVSSSTGVGENVTTGSCYRPSTAFSFEFYINPRYGQDVRTEPYHAGTLFHVSSSYSVSLVSGSSKDANGFADKFRLLLQLSSSAEVPPSSCSVGPTWDGGKNLLVNEATSGSYPYRTPNTSDAPLIFVSDDNVLTKNKWHHVSIRWGGDKVQEGTGSFVIDGVERGTFDLPASKLTGGSTPTSIRQDNFDRAGPDALFIGNFYEGPNDVSSPDDSFIAQFFHPKVAHRDGIVNMYPGQPASTTAAFNKNPQRAGGSKTGPMTYVHGWSLDHPLRAEVHEVKIYKKYRDIAKIEAAMKDGVENLILEQATEKLCFYVPPFFVHDTNVREILQTPFQSKRGSTNDPFNVPLAYGVGGHYLNLENFVQDFVTGQFPRLLNLSGSEITTQTGWLSCNDFLYATGSVAKRNLTILPNDNGKFVPNFDLLAQNARVLNTLPGKESQTPVRFQKVIDAISGKSAFVNSPSHFVRSLTGKVDTAGYDRALSLFVDDNGRRRLDLVSLNNLLATGSTVMGAGIIGGTERNGSMATQFTGPTPEDPSVPAGTLLTIFNRTRDASSDQVSFFDASNLFYGDRIQPRSYILSDDNITGSNGSVGITLRDNGRGNLYRADCSGSHAEWNTVGTLMYDEGLSVVKAPTVPRFGADQFKVTMRGQRTVYVMQISVPAPAGSLDLSSNTTYHDMAPSSLPADSKETFTYLTNLNFLDENLNVICKSNFSQAIVKRVNDRFMVRIRLDF